MAVLQTARVMPECTMVVQKLVILIITCMVEPTTTGEKFKRKVAIPVANLVFHLNVCICEIYIAQWILKILN